MERNYFVINTGSASKKYALYRGEKRIFFAHFETEEATFVVTVDCGGSVKREIPEKDFNNSLDYVYKELVGSGAIADPQKEISAVGFRIVAPGEYFTSHRLIDDEYVKNLKDKRDSAPLHIEPMLNELALVRKLLRGIRIIGVSDSVFHSTLPVHAYTYAIQHDVAEKFGIRKFGFHGSSFASVVRKVGALSGTLPSKMIVCHLGSGCSITAIRDGKSIDTSMGLSPLEGVPMGTRVGDIDPGAVVRLGEVLKCGLEELEKFFYTRSGILGISGKSNDIRDLLTLEFDGDVRAKLALDVFVYRIQKYIGSYVAVLGGLDMLVFCATIGERSFVIRERICRNLSTFGIVLDEGKNKLTVGLDGFLQKSGVPVAVITTDEMGEIVRETKMLTD
ncbi:MAG: acetate/propionate family kinase [Candidatus Taylorbacteria bacterium]|nr:acetate/propionate family kinase [Candidatus Taylorbacteria bacterium]